jgi:hypothetical protein
MSSSNPGAQYASRFSAATFRVPDSILGNIGQPLDHSMEPLDEDTDIEAVVEGTDTTTGEAVISRPALETGSDQLVAGSSSGRRCETSEIEAVSVVVIPSGIAALMHFLGSHRQSVNLGYKFERNS